MACAYVSPNGKKCQFCVDESELLEYVGRKSKYCIFHLPQQCVTPSENNKKDYERADVGKFKEKIVKYIDASLEDDSTCDLTGVVFPKNIRFYGLDFPRTIFNYCEFLGDADFQNATFLHNFSLSHAVVQGELNVMGVEFRGFADFRSSIFRKGILSPSAKYKGGASFRATKIDDYARFNGSEFEKDLDFTQGVIDGVASFDGVIFKCAARFDMTRLHAIHLNRTKARGRVTFKNACISNAIESRDATYEGGFNLSGMKKVDGNAACEGELNEVFFIGVNFMRRAVFSNRNFCNATSFENSTFERAPEFYNSNLHQDTSFEGSEFKDTASDSSRAYRTLKLAMENVRSKREEGMFFALEQRCLRRNKSISISVRVLSLLYDVSSGYGQSVTRPMLGMLGVAAVFMLIYASIYAPSINDMLDFITLKDAFVLSIKQMVSPFYIWRESGVGLAAQVLGTLQSILFLGMFALFLLAVRWRFKRG